MSPSFLLAGGGSGGHVFPLIAVAEALRALRPGVEITFVGTRSGMEAALLPARGERLETLEARPIKGSGWLGAARGALTAARSLPAARALVGRLGPSAVLSIGGYAAGPVSLAARSLGIPVTLLEPNRVLGLSNRLITPFVDRAYLVFPEVERNFRPSVVRSFGLPLRPGFAPSLYLPEGGRASLLVLGGSQGAAALNERMPGAVAELARALPWVRVLHQAGRGRDVEVRARYAALGLGEAARVVPFVDDVPAAIAGADVVAARSGAGSIAEICAIGRCALYVPFPFAADDHQRKNAEALEAAGAAVCLAQPAASEARIAGALLALFSSGERRVAMAARARDRGRLGAARQIAADLLGLAAAGPEVNLSPVGC